MRRGKPLEATGSPLRRKKPMSQVSAVHRATRRGLMLPCREAVIARAAGRCELCKAPFGLTRTGGPEWHHLFGRRIEVRGGSKWPHVPELTAAACDACHRSWHDGGWSAEVRAAFQRTAALRFLTAYDKELTDWSGDPEGGPFVGVGLSTVIEMVQAAQLTPRLVVTNAVRYLVAQQVEPRC